MDFWHTPIGAEPDPLWRDELGRPLLRDYGGRLYTQPVPEARTPGLLDYANWQEQHRLPIDETAASPAAAVRGLLSAAWDGISAPGRAARGEPVTYGDAWGTAIDAATGGAGAVVPDGALAANSFRAYHGSPHAFDRFSLDHIGTGEGEQAYGQGLYFSQEEAVARGYRDALSGNRFDTGFPGWDAALNGGVYQSDWDALRADIMSSRPDFAPYIEEVEAAGRHRPVGTAGHLYEVEVAADPSALIDWQAPIEAQPAAVLDTLRDRGIALPQDRTGRDAYLGLASSIRPDLDLPLTREGLTQAERAASALLAERGVPGITYRGNGRFRGDQGARNFAVFDDRLIEVLRRYGWAGAVPAAGGLLSAPMTAEDRDAITAYLGGA